MPKSRKNSNRESNLKSFKEKNKQIKQIKQMSTTQQSPNQAVNNLPEIRQSPVWNSADMLEISGQELKQILDFVEQSTSAFYATNAVMSRNIINGKVKLKFEKLNEAKNDYLEMTPEEEAPYQNEVQLAIKAAIGVQNNVPEQLEGPITAEEQKDLPQIDAIVDQNGNPYSDDKPSLIVV